MHKCEENKLHLLVLKLIKKNYNNNTPSKRHNYGQHLLHNRFYKNNFMNYYKHLI